MSGVQSRRATLSPAHPTHFYTLKHTHTIFLARDQAQYEEEATKYREMYNTEHRQRIKYHNQVEDMKGKIRVYCRKRPMSGGEMAEGYNDCVTMLDEERMEVRPTGRGRGGWGIAVEGGRCLSVLLLFAMAGFGRLEQCNPNTRVCGHNRTLSHTRTITHSSTHPLTHSPTHSRTGADC